jgi:rhodanese-related sulfurtransferase
MQGWYNRKQDNRQVLRSPMTDQSSQPLPQIRVAELAQRLATPSDAVQFVDVREANELALAKLDGFEHLPLSEFAEWSGDIQTRLDPQKETIVLCHHGVRSGADVPVVTDSGLHAG